VPDGTNPLDLKKSNQKYNRNANLCREEIMKDLIALLIRHFLDAKWGQQKELESIRKEQKMLDQSAAQILEENLETSRALRSSIQELQDQINEDLK
jgi:hypothetical protein